MVEAFILVRVRPASLDEASNVMKNVKETIAKIRGVKEIKGVFGRYDFVATAEVGTAEQLGTLVTGYDQKHQSSSRNRNARSRLLGSASGSV